MLLETNTKICIDALNNFYELKDDEKLDLVAIILEHWSKEQILDDSKNIFLPSDVNFNNITSFSALCLLSAKILRKEESNLIINNGIEININIPKNIENNDIDDEKLYEKIIDLCLYYQIEDSHHRLRLIDMHIKSCQMQLHFLEDQKTFWFQKKKLKNIIHK